MLRFPVKSANLRNLWMKTVRCFGCPQAVLCNLWTRKVQEPWGCPRALGVWRKIAAGINSNYLTASLRALPALNFTTLDALILIAAPV